MNADELAGLIGAITASPDLSRGLCVGQWDLWDAAADPAAADHALSLCRQCPVLDACREWVDSLPKRRKPIGVVAGRIHLYDDRSNTTRIVKAS